MQTVSSTSLINALQQRVQQLRQQARIYQLLRQLPWVIVAVAGVYALSHSVVAGSVAGLLLGVLLLWLLKRNRTINNIQLENYLLHLNRHYPELEESAQLLPSEDDALTLMQQLQKHKISARVDHILSQQPEPLFNDYRFSRPLAANLVTLAAIVLLYWLLISRPWPQTPAADKGAEQPVAQASLASPRLVSAKVEVQPPAYSKLPREHSTHLNLKLLSGSQVSWQLHIEGLPVATKANSQSGYSIELSDGNQLALQSHNDGYFYVAATIMQSAIYTINTPVGKLDGVFSLTVNPDTPPTIRFISPVVTTSEIAKDGKPQLLSEVVVSDDFAVTQVSIQASIAKGSGEGVKFRDQTFSFDRSEMIAGKTHYFKHWQLTELGMEPGDEMYFSVLAWDNREPEAQLTRSPSKIVRWLEEEQSELASDGILLDVMPEYFKSQRQIIIETEQLLLEQNQLAAAEFKRLSTDLGFAQSDLKQKYGQFVGDEFESATLHTMEAGPSHHTQEHHDDEDEGDEHSNEAEHSAGDAHQHEASSQAASQASSQISTDRSGASALIAQYGHNHGEAELGFTGFKGQATPVSLMKQAIANMWNAELHLMMAEPAQALPYEKAALKYLNQAKQAERIYVKRLGFEPPPVSESRRYQGDLHDINNSENKQTALVDKAELILLSDSINKLQIWLDSEQAGSGLSNEQIQQLQALLSAELDTSAATIEHIATLQRLSLNGAALKQSLKQSLKQECHSCITALQYKLWSLLPPVVASPLPRQNPYLATNPAMQRYQQFLSQEPKQ